MAIFFQVNIQAERLKASERDTRRRHKLMQAQVKTLCEERADFLAQLQDQCREINQLRKRLGLAEKENEDLVQSYDDDQNDPNRPRYTTRELKELISERDELLTTIDSLNEQLAELKPAPSAKRTRHVSSSDDSDDDDDDDVVHDDDNEATDDGVEADVDDDHIAGETCVDYIDRLFDRLFYSIMLITIFLPPHTNCQATWTRCTSAGSVAVRTG